MSSLTVKDNQFLFTLVDVRLLDLRAVVDSMRHNIITQPTEVGKHFACFWDPIHKEIPVQVVVDKIEGDRCTFTASSKSSEALSLWLDQARKVLGRYA